MFTRLIAFEWRYFVRQPSFIVTSMTFFLLPYLYMAINALPKGFGSNVMYNSPHAITFVMALFGLFSMFLVVNFVADTAVRNHTSSMAEFVYTKPLSPFQYQLGRFLGSYLICVTVFAFVPLGLFAGAVMPWVDESRIGPHVLGHYVIPFFYIALTTLFVLSTLFYAVALRFNSMMAVYLTALGLFILNGQLSRIFSEPSQREWLALLDPFALRTYGTISEYWTPSERNTEVITMTGDLLTNRLLWLAIGIVLLLSLGRLFKPLALKKIKAPKVKKAGQKVADKIEVLLGNSIDARFKEGVGFQQFSSRAIFEIKQIFFHPAFFVLMAIAAFLLISLLMSPGFFYGVSNWPLTQTMVQFIAAAFSIVGIIIIAFYSAEVIWRERSVGMGDIIDSMPVSNVTFWLSKILSVLLVITSTFSVGMISTILFQMSKGQPNVDLPQYVTSLFLFYLLPLFYWSILAFLIQAISPGKYIGMLIFVGYYCLSAFAFIPMGIEHNMYNFGVSPLLRYSDLNGYAWYMQTQAWYMLYWGALAIVLGILSYGLWQRGPQMSLKAKFSLLSYNIGQTGRVAVAALMIVFVGSGSFIYYNTKVINTFVSNDEQLDLLETYEKNYSQFEEAAFPVLTSVDADIDMFPSERRIEAKADFVVRNKTDEAVSRFLVNLPQFSSKAEVVIEGGKLGEVNEELNTAWFEFDKPMQPNETRKGTFNVVREHHGFRDRGNDFNLVENGIFINNFALYPVFGVNVNAYIGDKQERKKRDLPPPRRAYKLEDESHYKESFFGPGVEQIDFAATLSTSGSQTAIAPGYLQKQWQENGRNHFRYEMDAPMINFFNVMSGELELKKEMYKGIEIAVYYHKAHHWNVDRMMESVRDSLDYFTEAFGPYQHRQVRIIEFPGYAAFAQSFANTVPYSEQIGFISDLRDPTNIDPVYYVTAHEVAHQWFGHQLTGANVQGSQILSESLSQYAALMVMERKYGEDKMREFLTYELDRYLQGRTADPGEEMPMLRAENQQYIHYRKGSVVMMSLKEKLGEESLNQALRNLLKEYKFAEGRKPTTLDLVAALKEEQDLDNQDFIDDSFNHITLYDLKTTEASIDEEDGQYTVTINVEASQLTADGFGEETEQDFDEMVDVVLFVNDPNNFAAESEIVYRQKHRLVSGENELKITVAQEPKYVGIDPFVRFIDRDTDDNILSL